MRSFFFFLLITLCLHCFIAPATAQAPVYPAIILAEFPHEATTSTQGLVYQQGVFFESSGGFGRSFIAVVDHMTGIPHIRRPIPRLFAEGVVSHNEQIHMLTWKSGYGFVFDQTSLTPLKHFTFSTDKNRTEGWGLTSDGQQFIMSNGTSRLLLRDFKTFAQTGTMLVRDGNKPISRLNELEYVNGLLLANIWKSDRIAIIDPTTGFVTHWIDLSPLRKRIASTSGVANGIAYDHVSKTVYVTGKHWDKLFAITIENRPW